MAEQNQQQQGNDDKDKAAAKDGGKGAAKAAHPAATPRTYGTRAATPFEPGTKRLTRGHMEQTIRDGGSVVHNGEIIDKVENLPTEADLAGDDEAAQERARENIRARREQLEREEAALSKGGRQTPPKK